MATSMRTFVSCAALLLVLAVSYGTPAAYPLYTIDSASDSLFVIESTTGRIVQGIGDLGVDVYDCASLCTTTTGKLYGVYTDWVYGERYFIEISQQTGAVTRSILLPGVTYAEGLAENPATGQIFITFGSMHLPTSSDYLGTIDPSTGVITNLGRFEFRADDYEDGDEIRFDDSGRFYLVNSLCCGNGADLYLMKFLTGTLIGSTILPISDINFMDFLPDGRLIAMDSADDVLMILSTADGSASGFVTCERMGFSGMALVRSGAVSTRLTTWGSLKATYR